MDWLFYRFYFCFTDLSSLAIENESPRSPTRGRSKSRDRKDTTPDQLRALPESLEFDIKYVMLEFFELKKKKKTHFANNCNFQLDNSQWISNIESLKHNCCCCCCWISGTFWPWPTLKHTLAMHEPGCVWHWKRNCCPNTFAHSYPIRHYSERSTNGTHLFDAKKKRSNFFIICSH